MKQIAFTLAFALLMAGCVSGLSGPNSMNNQPNYVTSQFYQNPMPGNDRYGSDGLPQAVGLPQ